MARKFATTGNLVSSANLVLGTGARTVAWRMKTTSTASGNAFFWGLGTASSGQAYRIRFDSTGGDLRLEANGGSWVSTSSVNDGASHGCSISNPASDDLTNTVLYIDGVAASQASLSALTLNTASAPLAVNNIDSGLGQNGHACEQAEFAIWNVELTAAEHAAVSSGVSPLLIRPSALIFYAPLYRDEDRDIVGGMSFTANGSPTIAAHPSIFNPTLPLISPLPAAAAIQAGFVSALPGPLGLIGAIPVTANNATVTTTLGGVASAATATHTTPIFDATVTSELGGVASAATATHTAPPARTAAVASTLGGTATFALATHVAPGATNATVTSELGGVFTAAVATQSPPPTATVTSTLGGTATAAVATFTPLPPSAGIRTWKITDERSVNLLEQRWFRRIDERAFLLTDEG